MPWLWRPCRASRGGAVPGHGSRPRQVGHYDGCSCARGGGEPSCGGPALLEQPPLARVERGDGDSMRLVYERLLASGQCDALLQHGGGLFVGPPSGPHSSGFREWAVRCMADDEDRDGAVKAMLAVAFNAFSSTPHGRFQMVYRTLAKANHSCIGNACVQAPEHGPGRLICIRAVAPNEEVTVSYLCDEELARPSAFRNRQLLERWEFECACQRCSGPVDDVRVFSCPRSDSCSGRCHALHAQASGALTTTACNSCGQEPCSSLLARWQEREREVESFMDGLPSTLYSAWALSEEFSTAHPDHWLTARWKRYIAAVTEADAERAETASEAEELRFEAAAHAAVEKRCLQALLKLPPPKESSPQPSPLTGQSSW
mmetsp:Transcript_54020/g.173225  ORF Transcript_54020/g.173225 Transcript_54020/m.173225 type:complete len:373 (+) Transcript_54020:92-1210(+)